jgi:hypothetical protein
MNTSTNHQFANSTNKTKQQNVFKIEFGAKVAVDAPNSANSARNINRASIKSARV